MDAVDEAILNELTGAGSEEPSPDPKVEVEETGPLPESDPLGADMFEIRRMVLGKGGGGREATADENREIYDALKKKNQIDLNDEKNLAPLEDPTLVDHMRAARGRLTSYKKALERLPKKDALWNDFLKEARGMSDVIREMEDSILGNRGEVEVAYRQGRVLRELLEGKTPHGFSPLGQSARTDTGARDSLTLSAKKADEVAATFEGFLDDFEKMKVKIFVLRRDIDKTFDGMQKLYEAAEEERRITREYLAARER